MNFRIFVFLWIDFAIPGSAGTEIAETNEQKVKFPLRISSVNVTKSAVFFWIWSHLQKSLMENFILCAVEALNTITEIKETLAQNELTLKSNLENLKTVNKENQNLMKDIISKILT